MGQLRLPHRTTVRKVGARLLESHRRASLQFTQRRNLRDGRSRQIPLVRPGRGRRAGRAAALFARAEREGARRPHGLQRGRGARDARAARPPGHRGPARPLPAAALAAGGEQRSRTRGAALGRAHPGRGAAREGGPRRRPGANRAFAGRAPGARAARAEPVTAATTSAHFPSDFPKLWPSAGRSTVSLWGPMTFRARIFAVLALTGVVPVALLGWLSFSLHRAEVERTVSRAQAAIAAEAARNGERTIARGIEGLRLSVGALPLGELSDVELTAVLRIPYRQLAFVNAVALLTSSGNLLAAPAYEQGAAKPDSFNGQDLKVFLAR